MKYRGARWADDQWRGHAVAVNDPARTMCGLDTRFLDDSDTDWESGSFRTKCTDCILVVGARVVPTPTGVRARSLPNPAGTIA